MPPEVIRDLFQRLPMVHMGLPHGSVAIRFGGEPPLGNQLCPRQPAGVAWLPRGLRDVLLPPTRSVNC